MFKDHLVQLLCHGQGHLSLDQIDQSTVPPDLEHLQGWDIHNFSMQHFQCLTTLITKNFFLISNLNLPSFSLKLLPLVILQQALIKSLSPSLL